MYSVSSRCAMIKQPRGGYIKKSYFDVIQRKDKFTLSENENIHPSLVGLAVDYLTRLMMGASVFDAFSISLHAAELIHKKAEAVHLLGRIGGINDESIINACKLAGFDVCLRRDISGFQPISEINPNKETISNIHYMVLRCLLFWDEYGPVVRDHVTFIGGYTPVITSGDGDFLTKDTVWDFKVLRREPSSRDFLQVYIYYLMGRHSSEQGFFDVNRFGIFNPRSNIAYLSHADRVPKEIQDFVCREIIGYGWTEEEYKNINFYDLFSPWKTKKLHEQMEALKPYLSVENDKSPQAILDDLISSILKRFSDGVAQIILYNPVDKNLISETNELSVAILLSSRPDPKKELSLSNLESNFTKKHKKALSIIDIQLADYEKSPNAPFYKEIANGTVLWLSVRSR